MRVRAGVRLRVWARVRIRVSVGVRVRVRVRVRLLPAGEASQRERSNALPVRRGLSRYLLY